MSSRNAFRIAPSQNGVRVASIWRFWRQGDEFYGAARDAIKASKLSFHRNGNWQFRVGPAVQKLTVTRVVAENWFHVVSLQWLLWPGAFQPISSGNEVVSLVDVPDGSKLVMNLLLSRGKSHGLPTAPEGGTLLWNENLRDRRTLLAHVVILPQSEQDRAVAARVRAEAQINVQRIPSTNDFYAEISWVSVRSESGNMIAIVPIGPDSLRVAGTPDGAA